MYRRKCEKLILEKMKEIVTIYHEYNPDGNYLSLAYLRDKDGVSYMGVNRTTDLKRIDVWNHEEKING